MKLEFNPKIITKNFFQETKPEEINNGQCFVWAYLAHRIFRGTQLMSHDSHAFIKYNGRLYDSENLKGVLDFKKMRATNNGQGCGCSKCQKPPRRETIKKFKVTWIGMKKRFNINFDELDKMAKEFIARNK